MGTDDVVRRAHERAREQERERARAIARADALIEENRAEVARYLDQIRSAASELEEKAERLATAVSFESMRKRMFGLRVDIVEVPSAGWLLLTWEGLKGVSSDGYDAREVPATYKLYLLVDGVLAIGSEFGRTGDRPVVRHNKLVVPSEEALINVFFANSPRVFSRVNKMVKKVEEVFSVAGLAPPSRPRVRLHS